MNQVSPSAAPLGIRLVEQVLDPLKRAFVGKDEIVDLIGVSLVSGENLFLLGPPGTAKSAIVHQLAQRIEGRIFDYLLTRFTEPSELFGPFDIRRLREGDLVTNTEGMLPEADFVFLDELLNANSAILNSLLMALNERIFRRGRETRSLPTLMFVGASNRLPEDETLGALFDRFLLRVRCDNVPGERLTEVLSAGWKLDQARSSPPATRMSVDELRELQKQLSLVQLDEIRPLHGELVQRLRQAGIAVSDRRAVKLQKLIAASALLCGRLKASRSDLWIVRYIWDTEDQREVLAAIVQETVDRATPEEKSGAHPRSHGELPQAEELARDLEEVAGQFQRPEMQDSDRAMLRDRLSILAGRIPWVREPQQREHLQKMLDAAWQRAGATP